MRKAILVSGFGGQGLMMLGKILARVAVEEGKHTTWFPSYGGEMRGGTAHCFVNISHKPIASPLVEEPDIAVIMNQPSLDKFEKKIKKGGLLILNSDLSGRPKRTDIKKSVHPFNRVALETTGSLLFANMVALGLLSKLTPGFLKRETIIRVFSEMFKNERILKNNIAAFEKGESLG